MIRTLSRPLLALLFLGATGVPALAQGDDLLLSAVQRIDEMYLDRAELEAEAVFAQAGQQLEEEIEWMMVDVEDATVTLRRGNGEPLGAVTVFGWGDLYRALGALRDLTLTADPELTADEVDVLLIKGATDALDRHSRLLYGERLKAFDKRLKGTFYGIGSRLERRPDGTLVFAEVFRGNPAWEAGVRPGDVLLRVDGVTTVGMQLSDATERLTGERATRVDLVIGRYLDAEDGGPPELMEIELGLIRDEIRVPNVSQRVLDGDFGYIRIDHFSELTEVYLQDALRQLDEAGALRRGLIIDLRGNTGGSMIQSARAVDAFVTAGDLVRTVGPDGRRVRGLAEAIWADDDGTEPDVPIVVLQNERTASGAEILAGSLRELERAVLIGDRSYGKGTVQKVYTLGPGARLKLTVARYLLAGGLSIADVGIPPDLPVGSMVFDVDGVTITRANADPDGPEGLLFVDQRPGWGTEPPPTPREDVVLDLAVRVLARSTGPSRHQVLSAAGEVRELVRAEEEQRLVRAFAAQGIDWSPAPTEAGRPDVRVDMRLVEPASAGQTAHLEATVTNLGDQPLHRALIQLRSDDGTWDGRVLPVGRVEPGTTTTASAAAFVGFGAPSRESMVTGTLAAHGRPEVVAGSWVLETDGGEVPALRLAVRLRDDLPDRGDTAEITLSHNAAQPLLDLRVRFEYPESTGIELLEYEAGLPTLGPGQTGTVHLGLGLSDAAEGPVPLSVVVDDGRFGLLVDWSFDLPRDGSEVVLAPPTLKVSDAPLHAPVGPLVLRIDARDDQAVDHLVVWSDEDKVAWFPGEGRRLEAHVPVQVMPGRNRFLVDAIDNQGLHTRKAIWVRGLADEAGPTSDADGD